MRPAPDCDPTSEQISEVPLSRPECAFWSLFPSLARRVTCVRFAPDAGGAEAATAAAVPPPLLLSAGGRDRAVLQWRLVRGENGRSSSGGIQSLPGTSRRPAQP